MIDISDFYVNLAGVSGTLLGTFMVGAFFYLDSEMHRRAVAGPVDDLYVRSGVRWALLAYSLPVFVSLTLSSLDPGYGLGVFAALSVLLLTATVATARRMFVLETTEASRPLLVNEWVTTSAVPVIVVLPWLLGDSFVPPADAYVASLLLSLLIAFSSTAALVLAEFDSSMGAESRPQPIGEERLVQTGARMRPRRTSAGRSEPGQRAGSNRPGNVGGP